MTDHETDQETIEDNTRATDANSAITAAQTAIAASSGGLSDIGKMTTFACSLLIVATVAISFFNDKFAENQSGIILSTLAGGLLGATVGGGRFPKD